MCAVNDSIRRGYARAVYECDKLIESYELEKSENSDVCNVLECAKEKMRITSSNLENVSISGGESYDNGPKFNMSCSDAIKTISDAITERETRIEEINKNIETITTIRDNAQTAMDNLPANCNKCSECCPPQNTGTGTGTGTTNESGGK